MRRKKGFEQAFSSNGLSRGVGLFLQQPPLIPAIQRLSQPVSKKLLRSHGRPQLSQFLRPFSSPIGQIKAIFAQRL